MSHPREEDFSDTPTHIERLRRRKRVVLVAPLGLGISGNCTTAHRIARLVQPHGYDLTLVECDEADERRQGKVTTTKEGETTTAPRRASNSCDTVSRIAASSSSSLSIEESLSPDRCDLWMVLHAYRGGLAARAVKRRLLMSSCSSSTSSSSAEHQHSVSSSYRAPDILIFGGTDVNELRDTDAEKFSVMTELVESVRYCVCFSSATKQAAVSLWPQEERKMVIISQSVDIPPLPVLCSSVVATPDGQERRATQNETLDDDVSAQQQQEEEDQALRLLALSEATVGSQQTKAFVADALERRRKKSPATDSSSLLLLLLPAGIRRVKNIRYALELGEAMAASSRRAATTKRSNTGGDNQHLDTAVLQIVLIIAGPAIEAEEAEYVKQCALNGSSSSPSFSVLWSPGIPHSALNAVYRHPLVKCVLNTSLSEGQPQAIMEAMAASSGSAVVAVTDCAGNIEGAVPTEDVGVHLSLRDVRGSAEKLLLLLTDTTFSGQAPVEQWTRIRNRMIEQARRFAETHFAGEREGAAYAALFARIIEASVDR